MVKLSTKQQNLFFLSELFSTPKSIAKLRLNQVKNFARGE